MEPADVAAPHDESTASRGVPPLRRRYSMEEDLFYRCIVKTPQQRLSRPPPYRPSFLTSNGQKQVLTDGLSVQDNVEPLPSYQSTLCIEGVFAKKHEIEYTTKRAEDRHWHSVFVTLNGTALNVYSIKKDWGWGKTRDGPTISPDNPPWVRKSRLKKSYSLLHADAGDATSYVYGPRQTSFYSPASRWRRLSSGSSVFAAIDVAAPIDDRDFPRDMSIPRMQRIRWFQGQSPALPGFAAFTSPGESDSEQTTTDNDAAPAPTALVTPQTTAQPWHAPGSSPEDGRHGGQRQTQVTTNSGTSQRQTQFSRAPARIEPRRLSTTNYPNPSVDPHTGKWLPENRWSSAHDLLYANLCYSNLLFRSPRKSNYVISKGKQWFVDWRTGRMVRVLPPTYSEMDYFWLWQVVHTENVRI